MPSQNAVVGVCTQTRILQQKLPPINLPIAARSPNRSPATLVIFDARVPAWPRLARSLPPHTPTLLLQPDQDALIQLNNFFANNPESGGWEAVHWVAHGQPGALRVGSSWLDVSRVEALAATLVPALAPHARLYFHSCRTGAGELGRQFVARIAAATGTIAAAASAWVGGIPTGGSWDLDVVAGGDRPTSAHPTPRGLARSHWPGDWGAIVSYPNTLDPNVVDNCFPNAFYAVTALDVDGFQNDLVEVDVGTGKATFIQQLQNRTNAIARRPGFNEIYYTDTTANVQVRIFTRADPNTDPVASNFQLNTELENAGGAVVLRNNGRAAFDRNGLLFVSAGDTSFPTNAADQTVVISVNEAGNNLVRKIATLADGTNLPANPSRIGGDIAFDPQPNSLGKYTLYLVIPEGSNQRSSLFAIDNPDPALLGNYIARRVGNPESLPQLGGLAFAVDGELYGSDVTPGTNIYRINRTTGTAEATIPTSYTDPNTGVTRAISLGDLATLPVETPKVNLGVTKSDGVSTALPGSFAKYTITVTNNGNCDLINPFGVAIKDSQVSQFLDNPKWTVTPAKAANNNAPAAAPVPNPLGPESGPVDAAQPNVDTKIQISDGDGNGQTGKTVTIEVTGQLKSGLSGTITNTVTATLPNGVIDPDLGPLEVQTTTATDSTTIAVPVNNPPTPKNVNVNATAGATVPITGLDATDPDGDTIKEYKITTVPTIGTLYLGDPSGPPGTFQVITPGTVIPPDRIGDIFYTVPAGTSNGTTPSFNYTATDSKGATSPATAQVNVAVNAVAPANDPPIPANGYTNALPNNVVAVKPPAATDPQGDLTVDRYTITEVPDQGKLYYRNPGDGALAEITAGTIFGAGGGYTKEDFLENLVFEAAPGFTGTSFKYSATDNGGATSLSDGIFALGMPILAQPVLPTPEPIFPEIGGVSTDGRELLDGASDPIRFGGNSDRLGTTGKACITDREPITQTLEITNTGRADLVITNIVLPAGFRLADDISRRVIPLGGSARLPIQFIPTQNGVFGGQVLIYNNDPDEGVFNFGIEAEVCDLDPDFGLRDPQIGNPINLACNCDLPPAIGGFIVGVPPLPELPPLGIPSLPELPPVVVPPPPLGGDILGSDAPDSLAGTGGSDRLLGFGESDRLEGRGSADEVLGDSGNDTIFGNSSSPGPDASTPEADRLGGGTGQDLLNGNAGDDVIYAGADNDGVNGGQDQDLIFGDRGNDLLFGDRGFDTIFGGLGSPTAIGPGTDDDVIFGNTGNDVLNGSEGTDVIFAGTGEDWAQGGKDDDWVVGDRGSDTVIGDQGNDTLLGGTGFEFILDPTGNDLIFGLDGDDQIGGNEGADSVLGGSGNDLVHGGQDDDLVFGDTGDDVLHGDRGNDTITGGQGSPAPIGSGQDRDLIYGNTGNDVINGSEGNDTVYAGSGEDWARGGKDDDWIYGDRGSDTLIGDQGADTLIGATGFDSLPDELGNDLIFGLDDNDVINGNAGADTLIGGTANDLVHGGRNDDYVFGEAGDDTLYGDKGNDTILGSLGSPDPVGAVDRDLIFGNDGIDYINAGQGTDTVYAGVDNDLVFGGKDDDLIYGDKGNDSLSGDQGNDSLFGGNTNPDDPDAIGDDVINGGAGDDLINGNAGNDSLTGDAGNDQVQGGQGNDYLWGGDNDDLLRGELGNDTLCGDAGNDTLYGGTLNPTPEDNENDLLSGGLGNDLMYGNEGDDLLNGCEDDDTLLGGQGADTLYGSEGNDFLSGDQGIDELYGGSGADTFAIAADGSTDLIADFQDGLDRIDLGRIAFRDLNFVDRNGVATDIRFADLTLATVNGVAPTQFTAEDFVTGSLVL